MKNSWGVLLTVNRIPRINLSIATHRYDLKGFVEPEDTRALQQALSNTDSILMVPGMAPETRNRVVATCLDQGKAVFIIPDQNQAWWLITAGFFYSG